MFFSSYDRTACKFNHSKTIYRYVFKKFKNITANITEIAIISTSHVKVRPLK